MAESTESLAVPTCENLYHHPKRVILQHRVKDYDPWVPQEDHDNTMRAYLTASGRSLDELDQKVHHSHILPPLGAVRGRWYITVDLHKDLLKNPDLKKVQHEFHRLHRAKDGTVYVYCQSR
ncbi:hypothetical protein BDV34DRAFT_192867 [Aspergillus parasiticus]|uniref:Uncharacterized protein n=1 Tax=Aspergillus parasiticus TaxID=5067 RepID=A0A5N6DNW7_ASPPA|nr:hypothetical protein BDV34DRAFT_192867 [Aspergillus parasiticus]